LVRVVIHKVYVTIRVVRSSVSYGRKATRCAKAWFWPSCLYWTVMYVSGVREEHKRALTVSFLGSLALPPLPGTKHATDEGLAWVLKTGERVLLNESAESKGRACSEVIRSVWSWRLAAGLPRRARCTYRADGMTGH